jgi:hypothetical protein
MVSGVGVSSDKHLLCPLLLCMLALSALEALVFYSGGLMQHQQALLCEISGIKVLWCSKRRDAGCLAAVA